MIHDPENLMTVITADGIGKGFLLDNDTIVMTSPVEPDPEDEKQGEEGQTFEDDLFDDENLDDEEEEEDDFEDEDDFEEFDEDEEE